MNVKTQGDKTEGRVLGVVVVLPEGCGHTESDGEARAAGQDGPCCKPGWLQSVLNVLTHTAGDATCSASCPVAWTAP